MAADEFDRDAQLLGELTAQLPQCRDQADLGDSRGVQVVGQATNIRREELDVVSHRLQLAFEKWRRRRNQALQLAEGHRDQRNPLPDVVVQLTRETLTLDFLAEQQTVLHLVAGAFTVLVLGDVDAGADVAGVGTVGAKVRHAEIEQPAVLTVRTFDPILTPARFDEPGGFDEIPRGPIAVIGMKALDPPVSQVLLSDHVP